jgi:hypothetical protein
LVGGRYEVVLKASTQDHKICEATNSHDHKILKASTQDHKILNAISLVGGRYEVVIALSVQNCRSF